MDPRTEFVLRFAGVFEQVDQEWTNPSPKMDWLGMENCLRQFLKSLDIDTSECSARDVRDGVEEIVAAFTKRG